MPPPLPVPPFPAAKALAGVISEGRGVGDLEATYAFARRYGLRVIKDAAHAFGTTHNGMRVGGFGDVACFSFDGIKNITSGEGGCVVRGDEQVLQRVHDARLLGIEKDTEKRYTGQRSWEFDVTAQGWRYHMSNIMAAPGLVQLGRFDEMATIRRDRARLYDELLDGHPRIQPLRRNYGTVVPHIYVVRIADLKNHRTLQTRLLDQGIQNGYTPPTESLVPPVSRPCSRTVASHGCHVSGDFDTTVTS